MNMRKKTKTLKIFLLNLGYCTGLNGSFSQYILYGHRYLFSSKNIQENIINKLRKIIFNEKPDVVCLIEIEKGRQIEHLINEEYSFHDIETKYSTRSLLNKLSFFNKRSNAFISRQDLHFKKHFLKNGTKKLLYEITLPEDIKLLMAHFSLNKAVRKKQFEEINKMIENKSRIILCGDFNIISGNSELNSLMEKSNLVINSCGPTFPAYNPKRTLDVFLCSKGLKTHSKILTNQLSDHLPVVLEVKI